MKVLLVPNFARDDAVAGSRALTSWLESEGHEVGWVLDKRRHDPEPGPDPVDPDLVISLGGDGTLLRAARIVGYSEVPLLGFSYGHLGFLTCGEPDGMRETVAAALRGELHSSRRATLSIEAEFACEDGSTYTETSFALNDMAVTRGGLGDVISFDVAVSGNHIDRIRGDGFIVSTATGSTGYALAAGGPIVTPQFSGMVCVPIAPHTILARAFLTAPTDIVEIDMNAERPAERSVLADGRLMGHGGLAMHMRVRRGPGDIILLDHSTQSFYSSVSRVFYGKVGKR